VPAGAFELDEAGGKWIERSFELPAGSIGEQTQVELRVEDGSVSVFHYWFLTTR